LTVFENQSFSKLITDGNPSGEIISTNQLLVRVRGLEGVSINTLVMFENGDRGLVRAVDDQVVEILSLSVTRLRVGMVAVMEQQIYQTPVGEGMIGRIVNVLGEPLDGKGPISTSGFARVFRPAPGIIERAALSDQLVTGTAIVDSLFPPGGYRYAGFKLRADRCHQKRHHGGRQYL
jgi:F-type H+-transporting ATPase subunit alpha